VYTNSDTENRSYMHIENANIPKLKNVLTFSSNPHADTSALILTVISEKWMMRVNFVHIFHYHDQYQTRRANIYTRIRAYETGISWLKH